jgi:hypothetical protein
LVPDGPQNPWNKIYIHGQFGKAVNLTEEYLGRFKLIGARGAELEMALKLFELKSR